MNQSTNVNYLKALNILFTAMLLGQIIFAVIAYVLVSTGNFKSSMPELENIFLYLVIGLLIAGRFMGTLLYRKKVQEAMKLTILSDKLNLYRAAFIQRCALLEGPVIFALIAYLLTNTVQFFAFALIGIVLFVMLRPTKEKVESVLQLTGDEAASIT